MGSGRDDASAEVQLDVQPDRHLTYLIAKVSQKLQLTLDRALAPQGVTLTQFSALAHIARRPGISNADLAKALLITPQATATLVRRLIDAALVERPTAGPGLACNIRLSPLGLQRLQSAEEVAVAAEEQALSTVPSAEQARLTKVLRGLLAALERC